MYDSLTLAQAGSRFRQVQLRSEIPSKKDVSPFVASNKGGIPVTRLRAIITLKDRLPAFNIETVTLGQTPHITSGIGGLGNARTAVRALFGRKFVALPSSGVRGNGGVLFLPRAGSNRIQLYAWNVERMSLNRNCSNEHHAEAQFLNWIKGHMRLFPKFAERIKRIYLYIDKSPCASCTEDLCAFATRYNLRGKINIKWSKEYKNGPCGGSNLQKLRDCVIKKPPKAREILFETNPQLKKLKVAKQQQHTYLFDKRVHAAKPSAVNRRLERLMNDKQKPASLLSGPFANPHNYTRLKNLFQQKIDEGKYYKRKDGGLEVVLAFKSSTGWAYGKPVKRLKMIADSKGNWHYFPVP